MIGEQEKNRINTLLDLKHHIEGEHDLVESAQHFNIVMDEYYKEKLRTEMINLINAELCHIWEGILTEVK